MTTAIIAEDEPHIRTQLEALLQQLWPELEIVAKAEDGVAALTAIREFAPDVAFLDVKMPGLSGLEVMQAIGATRMLATFITAFDDFAVPAYAEGVVDYIVKPVSAVRLAKTIARIQSQLNAWNTNGVHSRETVSNASTIRAGSVDNSTQPLRWIQASQGDKVIFITVGEVLFFQSDSKYTRVVTEKRESFIRKPLKTLIESLDSDTFLQIHRSTLVNVNYIELVERDGLRGMRLHLRGHTAPLQVAQPYQSQFRGM